jgi:hypothetical protein
VIPVTKEDVTYRKSWVSMKIHIHLHPAAPFHRTWRSTDPPVRGEGNLSFCSTHHQTRPCNIEVSIQAATQQAAKNVEYILKDQCLKLQSIHQNHLTADTA